MSKPVQAVRERWQRHRDNFVTYFWNKVDKRSQDECWPWKGGPAKGYGSIMFNYKHKSAHILAYEFTFGVKVPPGMFICHRCDNARCCNPHHLFMGTPQDNVQDMIKKGRRASSKGVDNPTFGRFGSAHHNAKHTEADVIDMLKRYAAGETQASIAKRYNASQTGVSAIIGGRMWPHVGNELRPKTRQRNG